MQALRSDGWHPVTLDQLRAYRQHGARLPAGKPIVLTFDNGYRSQYTQALPVLRRWGWVADENIQLSGLPPSQGGLTDAQVREMVAAGWELDTQGISHADLITLSGSALHYQVVTAREILRRRYGVPVNWFCYPSGHYDANVISLVRAAGFVGSTTVVPGWAGPSTDSYRLPRLRVLGGDRPRSAAQPDRYLPDGGSTPGLLWGIRFGVNGSRGRAVMGRLQGGRLGGQLQARAAAGTLRGNRPNPAVGLAIAVLSVALATLAIYPLSHVAPVVSLSVVYIPAVLLVATYWGLRLGSLTGVLAAISFNFFHLPPIGQLQIARSGDWVALIAFLIAALVAGSIADLARSRALESERRRGEADLAAALARELLVGEDTAHALASTARRVAEGLGLRSAAIELGVAHGDVRRTAIPLRDAGGTQLATLLVPQGLPGDVDERLRARVAPTLGVLVAIARRRDALQAEAVETASLRRSDDIKTALLRAVSHDLRTPLTSVLAAGHALGAGSLTEEDRAELSAVVVEEANRLAELVDKLLDLSKLQAGSATPRSDWVSIEELAAAAAEGLRGPRAPLRVIVDRDVPEIRADAAQLERAFANLLENARRYSDGRPVSVHARRSGSRVVISVVDQGPGIEPAELERIFEPFYRGRSANAQSWTGSGLGLAIAKGFIEANGGTISVQSLPGQGTSFVISLPIAEPTPTPTPTPTPAEV